MTNQIFKACRAEQLSELFHFLTTAWLYSLPIPSLKRKEMKKYSPLLIGMLMMGSILFMMYGLDNPLFR
ncbi:hypothetical protein WS1255 [Wolinella succinogenes]|uniref:Uncharacterized protein n=1 Tax=Wolinella succinogenes (strain ATCC 29543 / DSM 1740 / CCUG 13145 / JCM 31913 / LMG 7466 / NCTC 11488 / FDC 602W) TaxID=273121 RepID=Q7MRK8_WOLSU|nr:hypothetical protein WS1255 [Wolinella succinogenes]